MPTEADICTAIFEEWDDLHSASAEELSSLVASILDKMTKIVLLEN